VVLLDLDCSALSFGCTEGLAVAYLGPSSVASVHTNVVPFAGAFADPAAVRLIYRFHYEIVAPSLLQRVALQDDMLVVSFASAGIQSPSDLLARRNRLWSRGSRSCFPLLTGTSERLG
jgi:hypothetical protein